MGNPMGMMGNLQPTDGDRSTLDQGLQRADDGIRTRDPHLGKVMLYQLSHVRVSGRLRYQSPAETDNGISTGTALEWCSKTIAPRAANTTKAPAICTGLSC